MIERFIVSSEIVIDVLGDADPHLIIVVNDKIGGRLIRVNPDTIESLIDALERAR